jgi:uncharacterized membrane protein
VPGSELEYESRATDRLMLFSDAVVAIAVTLLAIELPVPTGDNVHAFWSSVRHNDGHYAAFVISFVVIAAAWSNHHDLFRYVQRTDARSLMFNTAWLMTIVVIPFATKLLTVSGDQTLDTHALRFGFYALVQVLESVALLAILRHMIACRQAPDAPRSAVDDMGWQTWSFVVAFGLSIPFFFVTIYAWVFWFAIPLLAAQLHRLRRRSWPAAPASPDSSN